MTLPTAEGDEPYEQLVRQQLDALGYDSAAIPDDVRAILTHSARLSCPLLEPPHRLRPQVLRAFLKDFDDKMELQEDAGPEAALKDLSVLEAGPASTDAGPWATDPEPDSCFGQAAPAAPRSARAKAQGARRAPPAPKRSGALASAPKRAAPSRPAAAPAAAAHGNLAGLASASHAEMRTDFFGAEFGKALQGAEADASDTAAAFDPVHWAALRPSSAPVSRRSVSTSSFIRQGSSTPRRPKCDPVALHARREAQWRSTSFLANSPRRSVKVPSPAPATQQAGRRRPTLAMPSYEVPTAKRRDALVTETRQRLRYSEQPPARGLSSRPAGLAPNKYVPPTDKRRDTLRWQVRSEMAWQS
eukprot:Transcript_8703.p1 GENE.Transcript_8703~~Transcript_8703.p1  ORF type:complete len:359 (+),score=94.01 Transcript_8703:98-1174(+)